MGQDVNTDDVIATSILLRVYAGLATPESRVKALLAADMEALTQALAEIRETSWREGSIAGYKLGYADAEIGTEERRAEQMRYPVPFDELLEARGEERDPENPGRYRAKEQ